MPADDLDTIWRQLKGRKACEDVVSPAGDVVININQQWRKYEIADALAKGCKIPTTSWLDGLSRRCAREIAWRFADEPTKQAVASAIIDGRFSVKIPGIGPVAFSEICQWAGVPHSDLPKRVRWIWDPYTGKRRE